MTDESTDHDEHDEQGTEQNDDRDHGDDAENAPDPDVPEQDTKAEVTPSDTVEPGDVESNDAAGESDASDDPTESDSENDDPEADTDTGTETDGDADSSEATSTADVPDTADRDGDDDDEFAGFGAETGFGQLRHGEVEVEFAGKTGRWPVSDPGTDEELDVVIQSALGVQRDNYRVVEIIIDEEYCPTREDFLSWAPTARQLLTMKCIGWSEADEFVDTQAMTEEFQRMAEEGELDDDALDRLFGRSPESEGDGENIAPNAGDHTRTNDSGGSANDSNADRNEQRKQRREQFRDGAGGR